MKTGCIPLHFLREIRRDKTMSNEDWTRMAVELGLDGTEMYEPLDPPLTTYFDPHGWITPIT